MEAPKEDATGDEPKVDFNDVFSLRKPRDARAGLASGAKSLVKGVVGGAAGLVAAPIIGAQQGGVTGFAKGLASGIVGAVVLPVTGVSVGAVQVVRGIINTPEAISQATQGKLWDEDRREWIEKGALMSLEPPGGTGAANGKGRGAGFRRPTSGDDYYEILQVPRDATPDAIKKQYYLLARKWHPDKNPGDETAHQKFQKLGEAYQVLGNAQLRERYDAHGTEGLDVNFMEGGSFFAMLFGSDQFEYLVGELLITAAARNGGELNSAEMAREQGVRVSKLCVNLKAMLRRYTEGDEAGFEAAMREEAGRLVKASFGETMLHTIGRVYDMQADIIAGGFFGGTLALFRAKGENMKSQFQAASAAIKVYAAQQKIEAWQKEQDRKAAAAAAAAATPAAGTPAGTGPAGEGAAGAPTQGGAAGADAAAAASTQPSAAAGAGAGPGAGAATAGADAGAAAGASAKAAGPSIEQLMERQKLEEAALPLMLEAMWAANVLDIQGTLKKVCKFVLTEEGVPKPELQARAQALKMLGAIFMEAKAPESSGQDARKQMEEAMMRVVEKRAQQEGGADGAEQDSDD